MTKKRILSGVQPTGEVHLGNWLGAIKNWTNLQHNYDTYVCVVDLHAITLPHNPKILAHNTLSTAAIYLACGMDPKKSTIFVQSHIPQHSELCWILNCITPINWMERMIQFKEKSTKQGKNVSIGLFDYPVLMAADIILYNPDLVPVGEDQKQHLELARDIAQQRINGQFSKEGKEIVNIPKPLIMKEGSKIMSLLDGTKKMSKSDPNDMSRINILDTPDVISKKIKKAKTDSSLGLEFDNKERPEASNLINIYQLISEDDRNDIANEFKSISWGKFKPILTEKLIDILIPIQEKYNFFINDKPLLNNILINGKNNAQELAKVTLNRIKDSMGFLP